MAMDFPAMLLLQIDRAPAENPPPVLLTSL
jgi:hypothetical protein